MNYPPEVQEFLEKYNPETNAALVIRKLQKLMEMEYQGY